MVTGGSRGIGAATATRLAGDGWDVAISYRERRTDADRVVQSCERAGARAIAVQADLGVAEQIEPMFAAVDEHLGTLGCLVNNAGIVPEPLCRLDEFDAERVSRVLAVNVTGAILAAGAAVRRMSTRHGGAGGVIVNVSSRASQRGGAGEYVDYAASKGALDSVTVGLAAEIAAEGVRVVGVRPGLIRTNIHRDSRLAKLAPTVPIRRVGEADEVAAAICWLAGDGASYVTGATLDVGGGR